METSSIAHLPAEITLDILSRLPAMSVLECKLVCKTWRTLLHRDTSFPDMHLRRQSILHLELDDSAVANKMAGTGFNFKSLLLRDDKSQLYYGEYDDEIININDKQQAYKKLKKINHPSFKGRVVGSCNGLICYFEFPHSFHDISLRIRIFNPINKEYVKLPTLSYKKHSSSYTVNRFSYNPSTNEYKVVTIYYPKNPFYILKYKRQHKLVGHLQVYTLGSGNVWKDKGEITYLLRPWSSGIFINGALHWMDREGKIVVFDLAEEEFCFLPLLPCVLPSNHRDFCFKLLVLRGCLSSVVHQKRDKRLDIWSFKPQKNKKNTSYGTKEREHYSWSWTREVIIPSWQGSKEYVYYYDPFALTKSGEVLFWHKYFSTVVCYDPKTETFKKLFDNFRGLGSIEATPHMNSFLSLKALKEKCTRKRKSWQNELGDGVEFQSQTGCPN